MIDRIRAFRHSSIRGNKCGSGIRGTVATAQLRSLVAHSRRSRKDGHKYLKSNDDSGFQRIFICITLLRSDALPSARNSA